MRVYYKQGQNVRRTDVIQKLEKQKNILKIRQTNIHTENWKNRKVIRKFAFRPKKIFTAAAIKMKYILESKKNILHFEKFM